LWVMVYQKKSTGSSYKKGLVWEIEMTLWGLFSGGSGYSSGSRPGKWCEMELLLGWFSVGVKEKRAFSIVGSVGSSTVDVEGTTEWWLVCCVAERVKEMGLCFFGLVERK
jgi:hypothetical protein